MLHVSRVQHGLREVPGALECQPVGCQDSWIHEAKEITREQWEALVPGECGWSRPTQFEWFRLKDRISDCIAKETGGKVLPLSWDRVVAIRDREWGAVRKSVNTLTQPGADFE